MVYNIKTKRRNTYSQQISNTTASHEIRNIVILHSSSGAKPISIKAAVIAALNVKGVETARTIGIVLVIVQQGASMSPTTVSHSHSIQILPLQVLDSVVSSPGRLHFHGGGGFDINPIISGRSNEGGLARRGGFVHRHLVSKSCEAPPSEAKTAALGIGGITIGLLIGRNDTLLTSELTGIVNGILATLTTSDRRDRCRTGTKQKKTLPAALGRLGGLIGPACLVTAGLGALRDII